MLKTLSTIKDQSAHNLFLSDVKIKLFMLFSVTPINDQWTHYGGSSRLGLL